MATQGPASVPYGVEHSQRNVLATGQRDEPMAGANNRGKVTTISAPFSWCCRRHAELYGHLSAEQLVALPARCARGRETPSPYCPYCGWQSCSPRCPTNRSKGELGRIDLGGEPVVRLPLKPRDESSAARRLLIVAVLGAAAIAAFIALAELGVIDVVIR